MISPSRTNCPTSGTLPGALELGLHDHRLAQPLHNALNFALDPAQQILAGRDVVDEPDGGAGGPNLYEWVSTSIG